MKLFFLLLFSKKTINLIKVNNNKTILDDFKYKEFCLSIGDKILQNSIRYSKDVGKNIDEIYHIIITNLVSTSEKKESFFSLFDTCVNMIKTYPFKMDSYLIKHTHLMIVSEYLTKMKFYIKQKVKHQVFSGIASFEQTEILNTLNQIKSILDFFKQIKPEIEENGFFGKNLQEEEKKNLVLDFFKIHLKMIELFILLGNDMHESFLKLADDKFEELNDKIPSLPYVQQHAELQRSAKRDAITGYISGYNISHLGINKIYASDIKFNFILKSFKEVLQKDYLETVKNNENVISHLISFFLSSVIRDKKEKAEQLKFLIYDLIKESKTNEPLKNLLISSFLLIISEMKKNNIPTESIKKMEGATSEILKSLK